MPTAYITFDLYNMDFEAARPISTGNGLHNTQQFGGRQQTTEKLNCSYFYIYNNFPSIIFPQSHCFQSLIIFSLLHVFAIRPTLKVLIKSLPAQKILTSSTANKSQISSRQWRLSNYLVQAVPKTCLSQVCTSVKMVFLHIKCAFLSLCLCLPNHSLSLKWPFPTLESTAQMPHPPWSLS